MNPSITVVAVTCQKIVEHAQAIQKTLRSFGFHGYDAMQRMQKL